MTTVKVEKEKKISSGAFYEVSKTQQTGIKQKKKSCIEGTWIYENTVKSLMLSGT